MRFLKFVSAFRKNKKEEFRSPMATIGRFRVRCRRCNRVFRANSHLARSCKTCRMSADEASAITGRAQY